jgi:hypothetical protein
MFFFVQVQRNHAHHDPPRRRCSDVVEHVHQRDWCKRQSPSFNVWLIGIFW